MTQHEIFVIQEQIKFLDSEIRYYEKMIDKKGRMADQLRQIVLREQQNKYDRIRKQLEQ